MTIRDQGDNGVGHDQVRRFYDHEYYAGVEDVASLSWQVRRIAARRAMFELEGRRMARPWRWLAHLPDGLWRLARRQLPTLIYVLRKDRGASRNADEATVAGAPGHAPR